MSGAWRVAVTRDEGDGGPLAVALRRAGLEPVACPAVREEAAPDPGRVARAAASLEERDWLVVASARAVRVLHVARAERPFPRGLRSAAVGGRTAEALRAAGVESVLRATRAGAGPLLDALRRADSWRGRDVLLPRAEEGGRDLGAGLRALGAEVDEVIAYRTVARDPEEIAADWRAGAPDAAIVASSSAARALVAALGADVLRGARLVVALGEATRATLAQCGVEAEVPKRTDFEGAAALVAARLPRGGRT